MDLEEKTKEFEKMAAREAEIMQLLGTEVPEKLIHDLRNVLNELTLLRAVAELG